MNRAKDLDLAVGLIGIVQKILTLEQAARTTDFIIENRNSFVGVDMADMDIGYEIRKFAPLILNAKSNGLHVTLHSGEEDVLDAAQHVRVAIEELGAERIGHGIHTIKDPAVLEFIRQQNVLLEICPTSNWLTNSVPSTAAHPIRKLMESGVAVSINSDDPGIFDIDLCHEYNILFQEHGFTRAEFDNCNDTAALHSFIDHDQKQKVWPKALICD